MISSKIENANYNCFASFVIINKCDKYLRVARFKIEIKTTLFIFIDSTFKLSVHDVS